LLTAQEPGPDGGSLIETRWTKALGYVVGLAVIAILVYLGGPTAVRATVKPRIGYLLLCFLANLFMLAASSLRWGYIVDAIEGRRVCSYWSYFSFFISGRFLGQYVSRAGGDFLLRPGLLSQTNEVALSKAVSASLLDKAFDLAIVALLIVPSVLYLVGIVPGFVSAAIAAALLSPLSYVLLWKTSALVALLQSGLRRAHALLSRLPLLRRVTKHDHLNSISNLDKLKLLERKSLLAILAMTSARYFLVVARLYLLVMALDLSIPVSILLPGIVVAQAGLILAFTPGALGILEGGWYVILGAAGIPQTERSAFLLGQRVYWFIFTTVVFLVVYLVSGARWLKK
jgi:uncharacterized protein (TIRG00374 family)